MSGCLNMLVGNSGSPINAQACSASDTETSPANPVATITFESTGLVSSAGNGASTAFTWLNIGAASAYDIRFNGTVTGTGASLSGTGTPVGSFYNLGSNRSITLTRTGPGGSSNSLGGTGSYDICYAGVPANIIASGTLALSVTKDTT